MFTYRTHLRSQEAAASRFLTPINEITFFSFCGGEWGWVAPYKNTRDDRFQLRLAQCQPPTAGVKAIREIDPQARMVHIDPLVQVVSQRDRPDQIEAADHETYVDTFLRFSTIALPEAPDPAPS